jgi:hypothetical protein
VSDTIRAALEAAAETAQATLWNACPGRVCPSMPCLCIENATAAAIAAFLRALPDRIRRTVLYPNGGEVTPWPSLEAAKELAAAVEEAAKEPRHG